jgi:hypothetical protein
MKFGPRRGVSPLVWLIAVASLVLGCTEDQKHNPVHDGGTPDEGSSALVLDAGSAADASDSQDRLDASPRRWRRTRRGRLEFPGPIGRCPRR